MIHTERLALSPLVAADAPALFAYRSDPQVARFQGFRPASRDDAAAFIAALPTGPLGSETGWTQLGIRRDERLVGDLGVRFAAPDRQQVEVGVSLHPDAQGTGLATEALTGLLDHLFGPLARHRVFASVDPRNTAAMTLMQRLGLRQEAWHRQSYWFDGAWADDVVFATLRDEWLTRRIGAPAPPAPAPPG